MYIVPIKAQYCKHFFKQKNHYEGDIMTRILIAGLPEKTPKYVDALIASGMEPVVTLECPDETTLSQYDGLLLPGGADIDPARYGQPMNGSRNINPELDDKQFAILDVFAKANKPILGICKGHQVLNVYFGGTLIQHIPQYECHTCDDADKAHPTTAVTGSWLADLYGTEFSVNSAHHQAVDQAAPGFQVIQMSDDGVIEAIAHPDKPILSLQWHPERMCYDCLREDTVDASKVFLYFKKLCEQ